MFKIVKERNYVCYDARDRKVRSCARALPYWLDTCKRKIRNKKILPLAPYLLLYLTVAFLVIEKEMNTNELRLRIIFL